MDAKVTDNKWIGKRTIRPDGADKVTGRAAFGADHSLPACCGEKFCEAPILTPSKMRWAFAWMICLCPHPKCSLPWTKIPRE